MPIWASLQWCKGQIWNKVIGTHVSVFFYFPPVSSGDVGINDDKEQSFSPGMGY